MNKWKLKQKIMGLIMIIISIMLPIVLDGDATASVIIILLGIWLFFTKDCVLC